VVQLLLIVGSSIFVLLGVVHGVLTLQDLSNPRNFTPRDAELRAAMQQSAVAFHPKINLWKAGLGFHFRHSLGLVMAIASDLLCSAARFYILAFFIRYCFPSRLFCRVVQF
jgi:hypothetical protein